MITKKSTSIFLASVGAFSFSASATALLQPSQLQQHKPVTKMAQVSKPRIDDCKNYDDTVLYFSTPKQVSVRVFRPKNTSRSSLTMNIFDSRNNKSLVTCGSATDISKDNQIIYRAKANNSNNIYYYAIISMNNKFQIAARLEEQDQNGQRRGSEYGVGEVTLKKRVSN